MEKDSRTPIRLRETPKADMTASYKKASEEGEQGHTASHLDRKSGLPSKSRKEDMTASYKKASKTEVSRDARP